MGEACAEGESGWVAAGFGEVGWGCELAEVVGRVGELGCAEVEVGVVDRGRGLAEVLGGAGCDAIGPPRPGRGVERVALRCTGGAEPGEEGAGRRELRGWRARWIGVPEGAGVADEAGLGVVELCVAGLGVTELDVAGLGVAELDFAELGAWRSAGAGVASEVVAGRGAGAPAGADCRWTGVVALVSSADVCGVGVLPLGVGVEEPLGADAFRCTGRGAAPLEAGPVVRDVGVALEGPVVRDVGVAPEVGPVCHGVDAALEGVAPEAVVHCTGVLAAEVFGRSDAEALRGSDGLAGVVVDGVRCTGDAAGVEPVLLEAPGPCDVVPLPEPVAERWCTAGGVDAGGVADVRAGVVPGVPPRTGCEPASVAGLAARAEVPVTVGPPAEPLFPGPLTVARWTGGAPAGEVPVGPAVGDGTEGPTAPRPPSGDPEDDPPESPTVLAPEACRATGRVRRCTAAVLVCALVRDLGRDDEPAATGVTRIPGAGGTDTAGDCGPAPVANR
ncbi:hypothetical protein ABZY09_18760 [Streptomyces sp. NPDC002928]|uniref:hypothetical protein n=1 Tax=Streptomyces sp. NPDC002928 TaxID=3154440 RepID=UPI0033B4B6FE